MGEPYGEYETYGDQTRTFQKALDAANAKAKALLCEYCHKRPAEKTDSRSRNICLKCASYVRSPIRTGFKTGRNEPCPCGSGRKFKVCCLRLAGEAK